jgi:hypothetical protein
MSFLKSTPAMLSELEMLGAKQLQERGLTYDKVYSSGEGYTSPRAWWYRVNELLASELPEDVQQEVFAGSIGQTASIQFVTHCRHAAQALDLDAIVNRGGKWKFPTEKDPGLRWAFTYGVAALATTKNPGPSLPDCKRPPRQGFGEYGMLVGRQAMAKGSFVTHPEFDKFIRSNGVKGS